MRYVIRKFCKECAFWNNKVILIINILSEKKHKCSNILIMCLIKAIQQVFKELLYAKITLALGLVERSIVLNNVCVITKKLIFVAESF